MTNARTKRKLGRSELVEMARALKAEYGASLTQTVFCRETGVSQKQIARELGSWSHLRRTVGLPERKVATRGAHSRRQLVRKLRRLARENPRITLRQFAKRLGVSQSVIYARFPSWSVLRNAAGLKTNVKSHPTYTEEDVLFDLLRVYLNAKRLPSLQKYKFWGGRIAPETVARRFGGWRSVRLRFQLLRHEYEEQVTAGVPYEKLHFKTIAELRAEEDAKRQ